MSPGVVPSRSGPFKRRIFRSPWPARRLGQFRRMTLEPGLALGRVLREHQRRTLPRLPESAPTVTGVVLTLPRR